MRGECTYERSCNHGWSRTDFIVFRTVPRSTGSCNTLVRTRDVGPSVVRNAEIAAGAAINFLESCASRRKSPFFGTERNHFLENIQWILSRKLYRLQAPRVSKPTEPHEMMCMRTPTIARYT